MTYNTWQELDDDIIGIKNSIKKLQAEVDKLKPAPAPAPAPAPKPQPPTPQPQPLKKSK